MFPKILDGAKVLYHTPKDNYRDVLYTTGEVYDHICHFAVCRYEDRAEFYLFGCNAEFEVISDFIGNSVEECKSIAQSLSNKNLSWIVI